MRKMICRYVCRQIRGMQRIINAHLAECCMYPEMRNTVAHSVNNIRMAMCDIWLCIAEVMECE